jgi:four helix bundle protein
VRIVKLENALPKAPAGKHIGTQLLHSGSAPGSNYEEACSAEPRPDFVHKMGIALKELKEALFWLRVIVRTELLPPRRVEPLIRETQELCAIIAQSIKTAKKNLQ